MNKAELLAVLARLDIKPSRRLGQNFLLDPNLLDAMVRLSGACAGQRVLEIGPGTGALTERLLASGCDLTAVELDHRLAGYLRERFADRANFRLVEADACRIDLGELMGGEPFAFAAAAGALAAVEPAFAGLPALYRELCASGEPYRKEHLRITPAELLTEGVPARKISAVQQCLLKAVVDSPALNVWPTLAQMAKALVRFV